MKRLKSLALSLIIIFSTLVVVPVVSASNDAGNQACAGLESLGVDCNADGRTAEEIAKQPIKSLINTFSIILGAVAVIMIIYGGFKFVTSGGDADSTKAARNTIIYAAIGLVVVLIAQSIVYFVFRQAKTLQNIPESTEDPAAVLIIDNRNPGTIS
ncbi:MAG: hypothetical protein H6799_00820 [Candidatus Nomurabacteria bacterium]|nr:MAG: hypothetical protein H6799_00820 [Candidatus Nomurabacteria bacterium]